MRNLAILAGACLVGTSGAAVANPIMVIDLASGQQFPHTAHVQLTRESTSSSLSTLTITRDGEVVTATPLRYQTTSQDVGSGMTDTVVWATTCDCNVPIGQHSYSVDRWDFQVEVVDAAATDGAVPYFSADCDTACASVAPDPAAGGSGGEGGAGAPAAGAGVEPAAGAGGVSGASGAGGAAGVSGGTALTGGGGGQSPGGRSGRGGATSAGGSTSVGGAATGGLSETGGTEPATGGTHSVPPTTETGGESYGSTTPKATGGRGSDDAPATGGSEVSSAGASDMAGAAPAAPPAKKHSHSSGCAVSPIRGRLVPFGILAALGLFAWRRKK